MEQVENRFKVAEEFDRWCESMPFIVLIFKTPCWYNLRSGVLGLCITGQFFSLRRSPTFSVPKKKKTWWQVIAGAQIWQGQKILNTIQTGFIFFLSFFLFCCCCCCCCFLACCDSPPTPFLYNFKTAHDSRPPKLAILIRSVSDKIK